MGLGESIRNTVNIIINQLGTDIVLQKVEQVKDSYGSVTGSTVIDSITVKAVPSNYLKTNKGTERFGKLNEGEVRMLFPSTTEYNNFIGTTLQSGNLKAVMSVGGLTSTYIPRTEQPIPLQGIGLATPMVFSLDDETWQ